MISKFLPATAKKVPGCLREYMWAPTAAGPFIAEHLKSIAEYPPRQKADTLSLKKALEGVMKKLENPKGNNN